MRLTMPVRTLPAPASANWVTPPSPASQIRLSRQRTRPVTQVVNAFVALPRLLTQQLGSGGMLIDIGHGAARVELGFDISGVHKTSNRWIQKDRTKRLC